MGGLCTAATAAASPAAAATTCYGSARSFDTDSSNSWPAYPSYAYATTYCADINVKPTHDTYVQTCFHPSTGGETCNARRLIHAGTWGLAATQVKDTTAFYLWFDRATSGVVAY